MSNNQEGELPTPILVDVFLSYANEDRESAAWLRDRLEEAGHVDVWFDRSKIDAGENWKKEINKGLRECAVLLVLLTKSSIDPSREWIEYERRQARRLCKPIIPLRFEGDPPEDLKDLQYIDFTGDKHAGFQALLSAIRNLTSTSHIRLLDVPRSSGDAFMGREIEIQQLLELVAAPSDFVEIVGRNIAVHGMGGQGKTMLAEELVRRIFQRYPGGLLVESRRESPSAKVVLQRWAGLVLGRQPDRYDPDRVRRLLSGHGEMLVLIDDVNESDFKEMKTLFLALPSEATRLLTTRSENVAQKFGCQMFQLSRLSDDDAGVLVRGRLRARMGERAKPRDPTLHDAAIRRLVALVEGHALTLEITSARCNSPEELPRIVDRLATSLAKGLDSDDADRKHGVDKDNSVVVSLNISLEQLGECDEELPGRFAALGVFPDSGRMSCELIAAVWGDPQEDAQYGRTGKDLSEIYRLAMIKLEPDDIYAFHPMQRWFAHNLLRKEPDRLALAQRRYQEFLTRIAAQGFNESEDHWSRMDIYIPHLLHTARVLWDECTSQLGDLDALAQPKAPTPAIVPKDPAAHDAALRGANFALAVMGYVLRRPALDEDGRRLLTLGLACNRAAGTKELEDTFVRGLGAWYARSDTQAAEQYFQQALRWAEDTGDRAEQGKVLSDYGELQRNRTKFDHAIKLLGRALVIHKELDDQRMQAVTLKSLGEAYARRCNFDLAMDHYNRAIELYKTLEDLSGEADLLNKVGSVEFNRGNYQAAIDKFEEALPIHEKLGNRSMEGEDLNDMGISHTYLQKPKRALELLKKAIEIHGQLGNRRLEAIAISNCAATYYMWGRQQGPAAYEAAVLDARKAGAVARDVEDKLTEVWALNWEALAQQELRRPELALLLLERAVAMLDEAGPRERVSTWGNLGYLLGKDLGQREWGAVWLKSAIKLMSKQVFTHAFGRRTQAELEAMLQEIST